MSFVTCRKGSKRGATVDVLELTTKPRYSRVMGMPALVRIHTNMCTHTHTHHMPPFTPSRNTHVHTHTQHACIICTPFPLSPNTHTQHTHASNAPKIPPPITHTYTLLHYSLLEPTVDLDGDVLMRKTFVTGEEVTGFMSNLLP